MLSMCFKITKKPLQYLSRWRKNRRGTNTNIDKILTFFQGQISVFFRDKYHSLQSGCIIIKQSAPFNMQEQNNLLKNDLKVLMNGDRGKKKWRQMKEQIPILLQKSSNKLISIDSCIQLQLVYLSQRNILKELLLMRFTSLKTLHLNGNNILSVECLHLLEAPNLRQISLRKNLITDTHLTSKITWKKISFLDFGDNPYVNLQLSKTHIPKLKKLDAWSKNLLDTRKFAKLQNKSLTLIKISKSCIGNKNGNTNTLRKKWPNLLVQRG